MQGGIVDRQETREGALLDIKQGNSGVFVMGVLLGEWGGLAVFWAALHHATPEGFRPEV